MLNLGDSDYVTRHNLGKNSNHVEGQHLGKRFLETNDFTTLRYVVRTARALLHFFLLLPPTVSANCLGHFIKKNYIDSCSRRYYTHTSNFFLMLAYYIQIWRFYLNIIYLRSRFFNLNGAASRESSKKSCKIFWKMIFCWKLPNSARKAKKNSEFFLWLFGGLWRRGPWGRQILTSNI